MRLKTTKSLNKILQKRLGELFMARDVELFESMTAVFLL